MNFHKLFRVLVLGGATAAGAVACGGAAQDQKNTTPAPAAGDPDGGTASTPAPAGAQPAGGGGVGGW